MLKNTVGGRWKTFRDRLLDWWNKRAKARLAQTTQQRKLSILLLQKRYGYSQEKAANELDEHYSKVKFYENNR